MLRAADKVLALDPDWRSDRATHRGRTIIYCNAASVMSMAQAKSLESWVFKTREDLTESAYGQLDEDEDPKSREDILEAVQNHIAIRDAATPEEAERLNAEIIAKLDCTLAVLPIGLARHATNQDSDDAMPTPAALAAKARALMTLNDPDAIRDGLAEIADVLEQMD